MAADEDITQAKERIQALRDQITQEKAAQAMRDFETSKEYRLNQLTEEERHLEQQLEEIRGTVPVGDPTVPVEPAVPAESIPVEEVVEGQTYVETIDAQGNLVRTLAEDVGTKEADAPPPDVPADATMSSPPSRA
jgi:hypothetical protein